MCTAGRVTKRLILLSEKLQNNIYIIEGKNPERDRQISGERKVDTTEDRKKLKIFCMSKKLYLILYSKLL